MIEAKVLFSFLIILLLFSVLRLNFSNQLRIYEKLTLILIFPFIFLIIIFPSLLDVFADLIKVERGRDLLFYFFMILSTWGLIRNHIRINKLSSSINNLTSNISILSAKIEKKNNRN